MRKCNHHWIWKNGVWICKKCKTDYAPMEKDIDDLYKNWSFGKE